jgi:hypothetical protein
LIRANLHNFLFVGLMAALFALLLKLANRTKLAQVPVLGSILQLNEQAA